MENIIKITATNYTEQRGRYEYVVVSVSVIEMQSIEDAIDGCVDNKAGYQSQDIADKEKVLCEKAKSLGYTHVYCYSTGHSMTYTFMRSSNSGYCRCNINSSGGYKSTKTAIKLWEKCAKIATERKANDYSFEDPTDLMNALQKLGAISNQKVIRFNDNDSCSPSTVAYRLTKRQARTSTKLAVSYL